jgi:ABC-type multidrug transport system ATPase subunit
MSTILEFDSIEKSFDSRIILSSVYMKNEVGKVTGLLGRNGSGKSTLMKIVFGSMLTSIKSVRINKAHLTGNLKQKLIGYLPQSNWLPLQLTAQLALNHFGIAPNKLIEDFPVFAEWMNLTVQKLSGGYRRILEIYLILNSEHQFILLDEPFSGLMPKHMEDIKRLIIQIKEQKGIIISDHLYRHILEIADETYLLNNGKTYPITSKEDLIFRGYLAE